MAWFEDGASRIYYEQSGKGDPVLLLPGLAGSIEELSALREALATAGYNVIAADLPGSGRSEPQPRMYTSTYYQDDADSFLALLEHLAVGPTHLLGFSDGGEVALLLAAMGPGVVRSVVTWGSVGKISDPGGHLRQALYSVVDDPIPPMQGFRQYLVATYGEANARAMTQSAARAFGEIVERGGDISIPVIGNITCPVLLITGEHDFMATPTLLAEVAPRLRFGEVLVAKNAGHDVHNGQREWFVPTILDWLQRH